MKYNPSRTYELKPISDIPMIETKSKETQTTKSKIDQLRELKKLLDESIITEEEFEKGKIKILDGK